ncbi:MAG: DUF1573 domain-containing protein [Proteobacteria bacterium]|nr:DUF1573 domain-containing protein [Pseudomonadota bacterium]
MPPGGEGEIKAILRTKGRSGQTNKKITVVSNDPVNPQLKLSLEGEIVVDVEVKPRVLSFGQLRKGETASRDFTITVNDPDKIKITAVTADNEKYKVLLKSGEPASGAQYDLKFLGSDTLGRQSAKIKVEFEGSASTSIDVPIRVNVVGNLRYSKNLYFIKRNGAFKSRDIVLTTRSGRSVKIKKVKDPDKKLKVEIVDGEGQKITISVQVADPEASYEKPSRHKMFIYTNDKDEPKIEIGYTISERRKSSKGGTKGKLFNPVIIDKKKSLKKEAP